MLVHLVFLLRLRGLTTFTLLWICLIRRRSMASCRWIRAALPGLWCRMLAQLSGLALTVCTSARLGRLVRFLFLAVLAPPLGVLPSLSAISQQMWFMLARRLVQRLLRLSARLLLLTYQTLARLPGHTDLRLSFRSLPSMARVRLLPQLTRRLMPLR